MPFRSPSQNQNGNLDGDEDAITDYAESDVMLVGPGGGGGGSGGNNGGGSSSASGASG